jgi:hypothetical protein
MTTAVWIVLLLAAAGIVFLLVYRNNKAKVDQVATDVGQHVDNAVEKVKEKVDEQLEKRGL